MSRPKINVEKNFVDVCLEFMGLSVIALLWIIVFIKYDSMPQEIPMHYDIVGNVDRYGSRLDLFWIAGWATFMYVVIWFLAKFPHIFNYPIKITENNAESQYRLSLRLVRFLNLWVALIMFSITLLIVTGHNSYKAVSYITLSSVVGFVVVMIWYVVKAKRMK